MTDQLKLEKEILIYIPAYNCEDHIDSVLRKIPDTFWNIADVLVVDNHSQDKTVDRVLAFNLKNSPVVRQISFDPFETWAMRDLKSLHTN